MLLRGKCPLVHHPFPLALNVSTSLATGDVTLFGVLITVGGVA